MLKPQTEQRPLCHILGKATDNNNEGH